MSIPSINTFLSQMEKYGGPAKAERFYAFFSVPSQLQFYIGRSVEDLTFQCDATELPGTTLSTIDYRTYGPYKKIAALTTYTEIQFSFYCTNAFYEKPFFDSWIEYINPRNLGWDFRYKDDYATNIDIAQLGLSGDDPIYQITLKKAFPISVAPLTLRWSEDSIHRLQVVFAYDNYEIKTSVNNIFSDIFSSVIQQPNNQRNIDI